jgi:hypothetical protein
MNDRARLRYDRAARVDTFGAGNIGDFTAGGRATVLFGEIHQLVADVDKAKADQLRNADTGKAVLVDALREDMKAIAKTARGIGLSEAGFADNYRMPDGSGEGVLLTAGDAFVTALGKTGVAAKFIDREMVATFVTDLAADIKAIRDYRGGSEGEREESVEATAAIERLVNRSGQIVEELDGIVHNRYRRSNPDKLRAWKSASHLERMPQRQDPGANKPADNNPQDPAAPNT